MVYVPRARRRHFRAGGAAWQTGIVFAGGGGAISARRAVPSVPGSTGAGRPEPSTKSRETLAREGRAARASAGEGASVTGMFDDLIGVVEYE